MRRDRSLSRVREATLSGTEYIDLAKCGFESVHRHEPGSGPAAVSPSVPFIKQNKEMNSLLASSKLKAWSIEYSAQKRLFTGGIERSFLELLR